MNERDPSDPFPTTRWSVVLEIARGDGATGAKEAFSSLYQAYYQPLLVYVRRQGFSVHDAEDIIQSYFLKMSEAGGLQGLQRGNWKLRQFLLASVRNFLCNWRRHRRAQKRGGGSPHVSIDETDFDLGREHQFEESDADSTFDADWALHILERVRTRMQIEYDAKGRGDRFAVLEPLLGGRSEGVTYAEVGTRASMTESAVKQEVSRMRKRYRQILEHEIAATVCEECEIREEVDYLIRVLATHERALNERGEPDGLFGQSTMQPPS